MTESETLLVETTAHVIEVSEGYLTIDTKRFPDACVCLRPQEAEEVLQALLWWKYGSHARAVKEQN